MRYYPPPHTESRRHLETTENLCYYPPPPAHEICGQEGLVTSLTSPSCPQISCAGSTDETDIDTHPCGCPRREKPPPVPTKHPFAAQGENRSKLQEYLLDYYSSSTFNTCEHQLLPMMQGPPLILMVHPDAAPVAHHTPVPVPVHWQEEVKAGLDRDVSTRCDRACPRWRPSDILPQDGHMREEEWETKADRGHAVAQCQRHSGNTSHSIPVPSGQIGTCRHEENCL